MTDEHVSPRVLSDEALDELGRALILTQISVGLLTLPSAMVVRNLIQLTG